MKKWRDNAEELNEKSKDARKVVGNQHVLDKVDGLLKKSKPPLRKQIPFPTWSYC